ncbi:MAG: glycosyltransferase family 4 protein [bacterium]
MRTDVLLLTDRFGNTEGTGQYILHFAEWFTNLGYRITLGYGKKPLPEFSIPAIYEFECPVLAAVESPPSPFDLRKLETLARSASPRLIFIHDVFQGETIGSVRKNLPGVPVVWFAHDPFFQHATPDSCSRHPLFDAPPGTGTEARREHRSQFAEQAARYDAIVVDRPERVAVLTEDLGVSPEQVHVLPGRFGLSAPPQRTSRPGTVLFAGTLQEERGVAELIEAMGRIHRIENPRLVIAGNAPERHYFDHCRALAEMQEGLHEGLNIGFCIDPTHDEMAALYDEAVVLALPNLRPEPFPVEAQVGMEHGLPIVAFDVGEVDLLVREKETGLLAGPGDLRSLAGKLEWALVHTEEIRRMGQSARVQAAFEFHSRDHVAALNRLFEDLLATHAGTGSGTGARGA